VKSLGQGQMGRRASAPDPPGLEPRGPKAGARAGGRGRPPDPGPLLGYGQEGADRDRAGRAGKRGRVSSAQLRLPHSHVVEAEQVVTGEGPERGHCAAATCETKLAAIALLSCRKSLSARLLRARWRTTSGSQVAPKDGSNATPSGGRRRELPDFFRKVRGVGLGAPRLNAQK
jgi:hypothetical protein